ncbi:hypothetical protein LIER_29987 [Lithospermum erythrorhizon]|uniref:Aluminum-activated malate transporter 10 n=1 Tax=Lithospermum erythrorhizon TaxID=34254 RepID=A0AAV3RMY3_LITER
MGRGNNMQAENLEWRMSMPDGTSAQVLTTNKGRMKRICGVLGGSYIVMKMWNFLEKAWQIGVNDPKKFIHCLKVGIALCFVSLFYYMRPLYDGVGGGNAIWAVMTVVVVFDYTVGSTLYKCGNRVIGTTLAGLLGIGVHWIASHSGERLEPIILQASVFILASATTFSRFIPSVKARFDYGAMIFILTFSLVSVSGYRVDELFELAHQRIATIAIGTALCILVSMLICPVWAGTELHNLTTKNMSKLADSVEGCVEEYFKSVEDEKSASKKIIGVRCVLNSKASEEAMANFAIWEPAHGNFNFGHPWKRYLKVGASMRSCAYCIETLNCTINGADASEIPDFLKNHLSGACTNLSSCCANVVKELANMVKSMRITSTSKVDLLIEDMNTAVQELQDSLKSFPNPSTISTENENVNQSTAETKPIHLMQIVPLLTTTSLLIEIAARIENLVEDVNDLAKKAEFKQESEKQKSKRNNCHVQDPIEKNQDNVTVKTCQQV